MDINKKDRVTLKSYFKKNSIPTESNFADLIDGMLNQKGDGIAKLPGDPLSIEAAGEAASPQKLINFYGSLADIAPSWTLQLNPRTDQNKPETAKAGFSISDGQGTSRLFIDKSSGNLGVGTIAPAGRLDIANLVRVGLDEGGSGPKTISFARDAGDEINAGKITYKGGLGNSLNIAGAGPSTTTRKIKLFDNVEVAGALQVNGGINNANGLSIIQTDATDWLRINPDKQYPAIALYQSVAIGTGGLVVGEWSQLPKGNLKVTGVIAASSSATPPAKDAQGVPAATSGIRFQDNPGGGSFDAAWIQYYAQSGEACTLEIGTSNDFNDHIALMPSGFVGIGTTTPGYKLDVTDRIRLRQGPNGTAGIWLFQSAPNADRAFIGMAGDSEVGFWGNNGAAWGLTLDTATSAVKMFNANSLYFTRGWSNFPHQVANASEISNDFGTYKALMIVGNRSAGGVRQVKVWDYLQVNGDLEVTGNLGTHGYSAAPRTPGWGGGIHTFDIEAEGTVWSANGYRSDRRDLAENYYSAQHLEAGDVVSLDGSHDGIIRSDKAVDPLVLGVISTKPGVLLNTEHDEEERTDGKRAYPLALCGRVPCKVTDENGPIKPGDFLVSSSTQGHAMKARTVKIGELEIHAPGSVIGKALEPLDSGMGLIEVIVLLR